MLLFFALILDYKLICYLLLLIFVSVVPLIPAKVLGIAIDAFSTGTLTTKTLIIYVSLLFICPIGVSLLIFNSPSSISVLILRKLLAELFTAT